MARRSGPALDVLLYIDRHAREPLHEQLERQLRDAIRDGRLRAGAGVPSTRSLARDLGVARALVVDVYGQLAAEGYLQSRRGSGTTVAATARPTGLRVTAKPQHLAADYDFHPALPDLEAFPTMHWGQCADRALRDTPHIALGYGDPQGVPQLREVLAEYLGRVRGAVAEPDQIVICTGFTQGLALVCRALRARGARRIAIEDPSSRAHREIIGHIGLEPVPVAVDEEGIRVDELEQHSVDAVLVTPAHQFPTGYALSAHRRATLLDWAGRVGALVIEDDYDSQYRYDAPPLGAIQTLAPGRVVYAGTASTLLGPGLRVGWLVVPTSLFDGLISEKIRDDLGCNVPTQLTLARFIERGHLDRHLRRVRGTYRNRRDALLDALAVHLPDARVAGISAGLHTLALLPRDVHEAELCDRARARGVAVRGLEQYRAEQERDAPGLVLGYASVPEAKIERGIQELALAHGSSRSSSTAAMHRVTS